MISHNGWTQWTPQKTGRFDKYNSRIVVLIGGGKNPCIYLTDKVMQEMGNPDYITIMTRGNNIGFFAGTKETGYVVHATKTDNGKTRAAMRCITPSAFVKAQQLRRSSVYDALSKDGIVQFDTEQTPGKL